MKNCPKCNTLHEKSGKFCSRKCANSRTFTDETNAKRSDSCKKSVQEFWDTDPRAKDIRAYRRSLRKKTFCIECGTETDGRKTCSKECLYKARGYKARGYKAKVITQQSLILDGHLPKVNIVDTPKFGIPGKASTLEKEIERVRKITEHARTHHYGGHRHGSGRGKKGWYKGMFCDSSWELAFILYCEIENISIVRNQQMFPYIFEEKMSRYLPDFIIDGEYVEVKGYLSERNKNHFD